MKQSKQLHPDLNQHDLKVLSDNGVQFETEGFNVLATYETRKQEKLINNLNAHYSLIEQHYFVECPTCN